MTRTRTAVLVRAALVAALIAAGALIAIPIGLVPVTLQVLVLATAALVLTPVEALVALALYVSLGAAGVPVFAGGGGGLGWLLGPTGGFIVGFAAATPLGALARTLLERRGGLRRSARAAGSAHPARETATVCRGVRPRPAAHRASLADGVALLVFLGVTYATGFVGFMLATGRPAGESLAMAVAPFALIDIVKCVVALAVARAVRAAGGGAR